jgi:hypothetical protein
MCFDVNSKAKRWENKTVFKIVKELKAPGYSLLVSPQRSHAPIVYQQGAEVFASGAATMIQNRLIRFDKKGKPVYQKVKMSYRGIYACKTLRGARAYAKKNGMSDVDNYGNKFYVLELAVDSKDFLSQSHTMPSVGTYRKVTPAWRTYPVKVEKTFVSPRKLAKANPVTLTG